MKKTTISEEKRGILQHKTTTSKNARVLEHLLHDGSLHSQAVQQYSDALT